MTCTSAPISRECFSLSFLSVLFGELIWSYSSREVVAVLNALNERADER